MRNAGKTFSNGCGHMIKILLTVAVLGSVGGFAGLAMAQGKQGEAFGSEVSSQCAHRRVIDQTLAEVQQTVQEFGLQQE